MIADFYFLLWFSVIFYNGIIYFYNYNKNKHSNNEIKYFITTKKTLLNVYNDLIKFSLHVVYNKNLEKS